MNSVVEVRSALWQKLFAALLALPCVTVGGIGWLAPFVPSLMNGVSSPLLPLLLGTVCMAAGIGICWPVMRYSIRADEKGITQTNGFFRQSALWDDVDHYYLEVNERFHKDRRFHVEPVMFDAQDKEIFRGFAHILVSTRPLLEQRYRLWEFVELQLEGKKRESPGPSAVAPSILEIDWSQKSRRWKIGRVVGLVSCALLWSGILGWLVVDALNGGQHAEVAKFLLPLFFAPLIPHAVWLWLEKRKSVPQSKEHGLRR